MEIFKNNNLFIKGDPEVGKSLVGFANSFMYKNKLLFDKYPHFKRSIKLKDGSIITSQKLSNGQYLSFIDAISLLDEEEGGFIFYIGLDTYSGNLIDRLDSQTTQVAIGVNVEDNKVVVGIPVSNNTTELTGNIDWNYEYSWKGPLHRSVFTMVERYIFDEKYFKSSDRLQGSAKYKGLSTSFPAGGSFSQEERHHILYRYGTKVFKEGKTVLDTALIINEPNFTHYVMGYCVKDTYELLITYKIQDVPQSGIPDITYNEVWVGVDGSWNKIGQIDLIPSGVDEVCIGRHQCITFSPDCSKFTGVVFTREDKLGTSILIASNGNTTKLVERLDVSNLIEGNILLDSNNIPTNISYTITRNKVAFPATQTYTESPFVATGDTTVTVDRSGTLVTPIPISSEYLPNNTINILYLSKYISGYTFNFSGTKVNTYVESSVEISTQTLDVEYSTTSGKLWSFSKTINNRRDHTVEDLGSTLKYTEISTYNITKSGLRELSYLNLRDDIDIYQEFDGILTSNQVFTTIGTEVKSTGTNLTFTQDSSGSASNMSFTIKTDNKPLISITNNDVLTSGTTNSPKYRWDIFRGTFRGNVVIVGAASESYSGNGYISTSQHNREREPLGINYQYTLFPRYDNLESLYGHIYPKDTVPIPTGNTDQTIYSSSVIYASTDKNRNTLLSISSPKTYTLDATADSFTLDYMVPSFDKRIDKIFLFNKDKIVYDIPIDKLYEEAGLQVVSLYRPWVLFQQKQQGLISSETAIGLY